MPGGEEAERAETIERANAEALARLVGGEPRLLDCRPAWEALELPERAPSPPTVLQPWGSALAVRGAKSETSASASGMETRRRST